jgi:hypothetical protein
MHYSIAREMCAYQVSTSDELCQKLLKYETVRQWMFRHAVVEAFKYSLFVPECNTSLARVNNNRNYVVAHYIYSLYLTALITGTFER